MSDQPLGAGPMTPESAAQYWTDLTTPGRPDPRPWGERYPDLVTTLQQGRPADQVAALRTLYSAPSSPSAGEFRLITRYEDVLLPELATALGRSFDDLHAAARAAAPAFR